MSITKKQKDYENNNQNSIVDIIDKADKIIIGAGAGLSASAGLNYNDELVFKKFYEAFYNVGHRTIAETITQYWYLNEENKRLYWGFWANHINNIYYQQKQLDTYKTLYDIIKEKEYFIITTNADGQFFKGDFDREKIFSMQGSYGLLQCQQACLDKTYDNEQIISDMLDGFDQESLMIRDRDVPYCPNCGSLLSPNLRIDHLFVTGRAMDQREAYVNFLNSATEQVVFLELGVGYNTPIIIRYPFEEMTDILDGATLIRINNDYPEVPNDIKNKSFSSNEDINALLLKIQNNKR